MIVAGIDNGVKNGAIAVVDTGEINTGYSDLAIHHIEFIPNVNGKEIDERWLYHILLDRYGVPGVDMVFIEKAQVFPGQGVVSSGRYMQAYGVVRGICRGLNISYHLITPQEWKKIMVPEDLRKDKKGGSVKAAKFIFPDLDLPLVKDHNRAEALLIALYGCKKYLDIPVRVKE